MYEVQRCSSLFIDGLDHSIDTLLIMTLFCILTVFTASVRVIPAYQSLNRLTQLVRLLERGYQLTLLSSLVVKHGRLAGSASPRSPALSSVAITEYHQNFSQQLHNLARGERTHRTMQKVSRVARAVEHHD